MDNRSIFLYLVRTAKGCCSRASKVSVRALHGYIFRAGELPPRRGGTEWEERSVCIDCTWKE